MNRNLGLAGLVVISTLTIGTLMVGGRPTEAQSPAVGVVLRTFAATPNSASAPDFDAGDPIPDATEQNDVEIARVLMQRNPRWTIVPLGHAGRRQMTAGDPGDREDGNLSGSASIVDSTPRANGKIAATLRVRATAKNPVVSGMGFSSDNLQTELPPDQAYLVARLTDENRPGQVVVFATLSSGADQTRALTTGSESRRIARVDSAARRGAPATRASHAIDTSGRSSQ